MAEPRAVEEAVARLGKVLRETAPRLSALSDAVSTERPRDMRWSRKEILGHLVDSAGNNHQRFVRAQLQAEMSFPPYVQDGWLRVQGYAERPWSEVVALWAALNEHLLHVAARIPAERLGNVCTVSASEPSTLGDHVVDYVDHLEHHLGQILDGVE